MFSFPLLGFPGLFFQSAASHMELRWGGEHFIGRNVCSSAPFGNWNPGATWIEYFATF